MHCYISMKGYSVLYDQLEVICYAVLSTKMQEAVYWVINDPRLSRN